MPLTSLASAVVVSSQHERVGTRSRICYFLPRVPASLFFTVTRSSTSLITDVVASASSFYLFMGVAFLTRRKYIHTMQLQKLCMQCVNSFTAIFINLYFRRHFS